MLALKTAKSPLGVEFRSVMCCVGRHFLTKFEIEHRKVKTNRCEQIQRVVAPVAIPVAGNPQKRFFQLASLYKPPWRRHRPKKVIRHNSDPTPGGLIINYKNKSNNV